MKFCEDKRNINKFQEDGRWETEDGFFPSTVYLLPFTYMLIDNFGRVINYLRISVTDRCNLKCSYCLSNSPYTFLNKSEILTYEEILFIIDVTWKYFNIKNYRLTGGEPLTRKNLVYLISEVVKRNLNLGLTTNGILLGETADELYIAGLRNLNISLDTLSPEKFKETTGGQINAVLNGIKKASEIGFSPIKINVVVDRYTHQTASEFLRWARSLNLIVKFIEKIPISNQNSSESVSDILELERNLVQKFGLVEQNNIPSFGPGRYFEGDGIKVGFISAIARPFCSNCNRIRLTADGKLVPCLGHNFYIDIKSIIRGDPSDKITLIKNALLEVVKQKPEWHNNFKFAGYSSMSALGG